MTMKAMNRRTFLQASGLAAASVAAFGAGAVIIDGNGAWAMSTATLNAHEARTLLVMARHLFPHDWLGDQYYAKAVAAVDEQAGTKAEVRATVKDGVATLDDAMGIDFVELSEGNQLGVIRKIEGSDFFKLMHGTTLNSLYGNPLVYRHFGFEGSSVEFGGYLERGFDDIGWLPKA